MQRPQNKVKADQLEMGDEYQKAEYALQARRYDFTIEIMRKVLSVHPENALAFHNIARAYMLKNDNIEAIKAIRESLRLDAGNSVAHMLYGTLLRDMGKLEEAEKEFLISLQLNPTRAHTHYVYAAFLHNKRKDSVKAKEHARKALELDPTDAKYHLMMGGILADEGNFNQADAEYQCALSMEPDDYLVLNSYGAYLLNKKNRATEAFEFFRQAMMRKPDDPTIRKNFLLAMKVKHKFYSFFWYYSLLIRRYGKAHVVLTLIVITLGVTAIGRAAGLPGQDPTLSILLCLVLLFFRISIWLVNPLFNFLAKRGWLK